MISNRIGRLLDLQLEADPGSLLMIAFMKVIETIITKILDKFLGDVGSGMEGSGISEFDGGQTPLNGYNKDLEAFSDLLDLFDSNLSLGN